MMIDMNAAHLKRQLLPPRSRECPKISKVDCSSAEWHSRLRDHEAQINRLLKQVQNLELRIFALESRNSLATTMAQGFETENQQLIDALLAQSPAPTTLPVQPEVSSESESEDDLDDEISVREETLNLNHPASPDFIRTNLSLSRASALSPPSRKRKRTAEGPGQNIEPSADLQKTAFDMYVLCLFNRMAMSNLDHDQYELSLTFLQIPSAMLSQRQY